MNITPAPEAACTRQSFLHGKSLVATANFPLVCLATAHKCIHTQTKDMYESECDDPIEIVMNAEDDSEDDDNYY
jgi:hypothetical protein